MSNCKSCVYSCPVDFGSSGNPHTACVYILHTGKRRPCRPGEECTVYKPRQKDGAGE